MEKFKIPMIGLRSVKTAAAVFICLVSFHLLGRSPIYAAIAAIVSMQSTIENSISAGIDRLIGTAIGGAVGLLFILTKLLYFNIWVYYFMIGIGIIAVIYLNILIKKPGSVSISCIVFLIIMVNAESMSQTLSSSLEYAGNRLLDTAVGVVIGVLVNLMIKNRKDNNTNSEK